MPKPQTQLDEFAEAARSLMPSGVRCQFCNLVAGLPEDRRSALELAFAANYPTAAYKNVLKNWGYRVSDVDIRRHNPHAFTQPCRTKYPNGRPS